MKKDYMTRLERAARWRLPRQEAEDVIADYRDIVGNPPRSEEELRREVGDPEQVVKLLVSPPRAYRVWQVVFGGMAACALLLGLSPLPGGARLWWFLSSRYLLNVFCLGDVLPLLGMVTALVWFRRKGQKLARLPRAVPILLAVAVIWSAGVLATDWLWMNDPMGFSALLGEVPVRVLWVNLGYTTPLSVLLLGDALEWGGCFAMALLAVYALVKARTGDRRWAAVYIAALTAVLLSWQALTFLSSMTLDGTTPGWWLPAFRNWAICAAVGLAGTGVALC